MTLPNEAPPIGHPAFARICGLASWFCLLPFAVLAVLQLKFNMGDGAFAGAVFLFVWIGALCGPAIGAILSGIAATRNRWYLLAALGWVLAVLFISRDVYLHPPII